MPDQPTLRGRCCRSRPRCSEFLSNRKYRYHSYTQTDDTHCWPCAPRNLWLAVLVGCCSRETASCECLDGSSSQKCLLFRCNCLTPCRNKVLVALRRSPCLEHRRQRCCPWSTRQREVTRRVHVHRDWETRNCAPGSS